MRYKIGIFIIISLIASYIAFADTSIIGVGGLIRGSDGNITKTYPTDTLNIGGKSIFGTISAPNYKGITGSSVSFQNMSTNYIKASKGIFRNISVSTSFRARVGTSIFNIVSSPTYKGLPASVTSFQNMSTNYIKASQGVFRNISSHRTTSRAFETPFQLYSTAIATKLYWHNGNYIKLKLKAAVQVSYSSLASSKASTITLEVLQDATGNRTLSYGGNNIHVPGGINPVLSGGANQKDILEFKWNGNKFNLTNAVFTLYSTPN